MKLRTIFLQLTFIGIVLQGNIFASYFINDLNDFPMCPASLCPGGRKRNPKTCECESLFSSQQQPPLALTFY